MKKAKNLKRLFIFNGLLLVIAFATIQYAVVNNTPHANTTPPMATGEFAKRLNIFETPSQMPNLEFKTVFDKYTDLSDFKGQWVIVNFWATWCPPCIVEMPSLQALQDHYQNINVKVIGISLDRNMDGQKLRAFMRKYQFGPIAAYYGDWPTIKKQVDVTGLPTTYIINPKGNAIAVYKGDANWESDDVKAFMDGLI